MPKSLTLVAQGVNWRNGNAVLDGQRAVLGHWLGDGGEGASFWLSVVSDLQARGVEDVFIACIDG